MVLYLSMPLQTIEHGLHPSGPLAIHESQIIGILQHVKGWPGPYIYRYIRCIHGSFGREITIHTVIYSVCIRFWITLNMCVTEEPVVYVTAP